MNQIKIAIVDDHQLFRNGIVSLLGHHNFEVVVSAANGREFIDQLESGVAVDVVLLDLSMPEMDGFEVLAKLKAKYKEIKAIALSMHDDGNYVAKCIRSGANGYLLKNTDEEELVTAINQVYRGKKYFNQEITEQMIHIMALEGTSGKKLSPKEQEILLLIAQGKTTKQIAHQLFISTRTVETHRVNIMKKLDAKNAAEMIKIAASLNLID